MKTAAPESLKKALAGAWYETMAIINGSGPETDAAKYSRGRLALPEMLAQFEREARDVEMDSDQ